MYLFIDTSKDVTKVAVLDKNLDLIEVGKKDGRKNQSENLLRLIDEILKSSSHDMSEIKGIFIVKGPGSYTGLRVGVATANALAYTFGINVLGVEESPVVGDIEKLTNSEKSVMPKYSYPPKITKEKSRL